MFHEKDREELKEFVIFYFQFSLSALVMATLFGSLLKILVP